MTSEGKAFVAALAKKVVEKKLTSELNDGTAPSWTQLCIIKMIKKLGANQKSGKEKHGIIEVLSDEMVPIERRRSS